MDMELPLLASIKQLPYMYVLFTFFTPKGGSYGIPQIDTRHWYTSKFPAPMWNFPCKISYELSV